MIDIDERYEHYRKRFRAAMDARKLTNEVMAERIDAHPVTVSKLRGGKIKFDDEWRLRAANALSLEESLLFGFEPLPEPAPEEIYVSPRRAARRERLQGPANDNLPLFGLAAGSMQGAHSMTNDPVDEVPCPPALRNVTGAYALQTKGTSMIPRFFPKERLYVHPHQRVVPGDHVIVQTLLHDSSGTETWVKRYDGETDDEVILWQYNPPARMTFKKKYVVYVHRVLPVDELF